VIDLTFLIGCDSVSAQWRVIEPSSGALRSSCLAQNCLLKRVGVTRVVRPYGLWSSGERRGWGGEERSMWGRGCMSPTHPRNQYPLFNLFPLSRVCSRIPILQKKITYFFRKHYPFVSVKRMRSICSQNHIRASREKK